MKKFIFRTVAILILLIVSILLYVNGQEHKIFVDNKTIELNGEECSSFQTIEITIGDKTQTVKARARKVCIVKGPVQTLKMECTSEDGEVITVNKKISVPLNKDILVSLPALIADSKDAVEVYKKRR